MKGWYGDRQQHSMASRGIRTNVAYGKSLGRLSSIDNIYNQIESNKFPIVIYPNLDGWDEQIKHLAKVHEISEEDVRKEFSKISLSWKEFADLYDIENDSYSEKEWAKDEYKELKMDARAEGWGDEVPPFREWFIEEYGHAPTVREHYKHLDAGDKLILAEKVLKDVNDDVDYYGGFNLSSYGVEKTATVKNINKTMSNIEKDAEKTAKNVNEGLRKLKILAQRTARKSKEFVKETGQKIDKSAEDTAKAINKISKKIDDNAENTAKDINKILKVKK